MLLFNSAVITDLITCCGRNGFLKTFHISLNFPSLACYLNPLKSPSLPDMSNLQKHFTTSTTSSTSIR